MKKYFMVFTLTVSMMLSLGCSATEESKLTNLMNTDCQNIVNRLIGNLIHLREAERSFENGRDSFGASPSLSRLVKGYKETQECMLSEQKVGFFWIMLWHSDFDGEMKFYLEFVTKEVGSAFLDKAKSYRNSLEQYKRNKGRLHKINAVIVDLEDLNS
jgi:hypothetical protein